MRPIDADALLEKLCSEDPRQEHRYCYPCRKILEEIKAAPEITIFPRIMPGPPLIICCASCAFTPGSLPCMHCHNYENWEPRERQALDAVAEDRLLRALEAWLDKNHGTGRTILVERQDLVNGPRHKVTIEKFKTLEEMKEEIKRQ